MDSTTPEEVEEEEGSNIQTESVPPRPRGKGRMEEIMESVSDSLKKLENAQPLIVNISPISNQNGDATLSNPREVFRQYKSLN